MASSLNIGMSVPGATSSLMDQPSIASQVAGETEEERKRRIQAMQNARQLPNGLSSLASGYGSALTMS
jgi:hypothetical protein